MTELLHNTTDLTSSQIASLISDSGLRDGLQYHNTDLDIRFLAISSTKLIPLSGVDYFTSVKHFGVKCDGIKDDTVAIQNAINWIIPAGRTLYFPAGTCKITDTLIIPQGSGFKIFGQRGGSIIKQFTDNKPIFSFTSDNTHSFNVSELTLDYNNQQNFTSATLGNAIVFSGSGLNFYNFQINNITFNNCRRAITSADSAIIWGYDINNCVFGGTMTGSSIAFTTSVGQPNVSISKCYVSNLSCEESNIQLVSADTAVLQNIEFNNGTYSGSNATIKITSSKGVTILGCKIENASLDSCDSLFNLPDTQAQVIGCNFLTITGTRDQSNAYIKANTGGKIAVSNCFFENNGTGIGFAILATKINMSVNNSFYGDFETDYATHGATAPVIESN